MEKEKLEQVKELINRIADSYELPTEEQVAEMHKLTGMSWDAKYLQMSCCEYWSHNSLEETIYLMFHGDYPPIHEVELIFWKYKPGVALDDQTVYDKYRFGRGAVKALEALPLEDILQKIKDTFTDWQQNIEVEQNGESWRFDCLTQAEYWSDTHFWIFEYGRETGTQREHQILAFTCHNMTEEQIKVILECMEQFQCPLHIREEKDTDEDEDFDEE